MLKKIQHEQFKYSVKNPNKLGQSWAKLRQVVFFVRVGFFGVFFFFEVVFIFRIIFIFGVVFFSVVLFFEVVLIFMMQYKDHADQDC